MPSRAQVGLVAALCAAAMLVTACTGSTGDGAAQNVSLTSLMGLPDDDDFDFDSTVQAIEEAVAECMAKEGWSYFPRKFPSINSTTKDADEDEVDRIKREGLGFTYYLLQDGGVDGASTGLWSTFVDHNEDYIKTMSQAERKAYDASLYGTEEEQDADTMTSVDPVTGVETITALGSVGCRGEARDAFYGDDPKHDPAYKQAMQVYWDELADRTDADPRFITLNEEWSACMTAAGYDYETPEKYNEAIYAEIQMRTDAAVGPEFYADPTAGWTQAAQDTFWASATQEEINALYGTSRELTVEQRIQLEAIFDDEVAVGLADHACSKDRNEKAQAISADIEEQYAIEHADELKALAASLFESK